jgi:hypothetical protein
MSGSEEAGERGVPAAHHTVTIHTAGGHRIVLDDPAGTISITHRSGSAVTLTDSGVDVRATVQVTVNAQMVRVDAAMSEFSVLHAGRRQHLLSEVRPGPFEPEPRIPRPLHGIVYPSA